jgi:hypothetical protein
MGNFNVEDYIPVHERIAKFHRDHPDGKITTQILEHDAERGFVLIRASVFRAMQADSPAATGHAFEERSAGYVNKTSYVENCESSAVGRALAMLGYDISRGLASREEIQKVERFEVRDKAIEALTVVRENGHYKIAPGDFTVSKPDGKVVCSCKQRACVHVEAVRRFTAEEAAV